MNDTLFIIEVKSEKSSKVLHYKVPHNKKWILKVNPIQFRRLNAEYIDNLSKTLEKIGFALVKAEFPDITIYDYYTFFHPIINENRLKKIAKILKKKKI